MLAPTTEGFLDEIGIKEGQTILEIGCGTGNITKMLANLVGESGHVVAIDTSIEQIGIATQRMLNHGIKNVEFRQQCIMENPFIPDQFDIAYSRLTLMHTNNFELALGNMHASLKRKGLLVCEEASNAHYIHYPYNEAYAKSRELLLKLSSIKGMDPYIGIKLYSAFTKLNLDEISVRFSHPIYETKNDKDIVIQLFEEVKNNYIHHALTTKEEAECILEKLHEYINKDDTLITFPMITQIKAKKR